MDLIAILQTMPRFISLTVFQFGLLPSLARIENRVVRCKCPAPIVQAVLEQIVNEDVKRILIDLFPRAQSGFERFAIAIGKRTTFSPVGTSIAARPPARSEHARFAHSAPPSGV